MKYFYQNIVDNGVTEVTIIQTDEKRNKVEIIRNSRICGRTHYSGFWVNKNELIVPNPKRNTYFRELLKNYK